MTGKVERRLGLGRRQSDADKQDASSQWDTEPRAATAKARQAELAADEERRLLGIERTAYRNARAADERERWENEGGRTRLARNSPTNRQDLYESDFTDLEQMRRDRPDE